MNWMEAACLCETVYEEDWEDTDLSFCPVCEFIWEE